MQQYHAVVWIDHRVARVFGVRRDSETGVLIKNAGPQHIHHKAGSIGAGHPPLPRAYFCAVAAALAGARAILILGPAETKLQFKTFLEAYDPALAKNVIGVETLDQEGEGEILARARACFKAADKMMPLRP